MRIIPEVSTSLETLLFSVSGVILSTLIYVFVTKFVCCGGCSILGLIRSKFKGRHDNVNTEETKQRPTVLLSNDQLIATFAAFHILAHLVLLCVDVTCLVSIANDNSLNVSTLTATNWTDHINATTLLNTYATAFYLILTRLPRMSLYYEAGSLLVFPILCALCMVGSQFKLKTFSLRRYLRMLRFADVYMCLLTAPFSYTSLIGQGGVWYAMVAIRMVCHATIFTAAVIAGMTVLFFLCCFMPTPKVDVPSTSSEIEIRGYGHLFAIIAFRVGPIALSFYTASSALNTYLKLSSIYKLGAAAEVVYVVLTLAKGTVSLLRLVVSALFLRWNLLTEDARNAKNTIHVIKYLDRTELHIHLLFVADVVVYSGLIVLNSYVVATY